MGGGAGPVLERGLLDVVVDVGAVPLLSVVRGVGAGREGVDLVAGAGAHPLVSVPDAVGACVDGGDPVGMVEAAAGVPA
jgi:hypothetical protein